MKGYVLLIAFFILLNLVFIGEQEPFYNVQAVLVPFSLETGRILIGRFFLTISLFVVYLSKINYCLDEQFNMLTTILTRINVKKSIFKLSVYTVREIGIFIVINTVINIIFSQAQGFENVWLFVGLTLSLLITCLIWIEVVSLLKLYQMASKFIYLGFIFFISLSVLLSNQLPVVTLFLPGTIAFLEHPSLWILYKLTLLICLILIKRLKLMKFEYLGGRNDD